MAKDTPPAPAVTLADSELSEMSKNETLKLESQGLFWVAGKNKHSFRSEIEDLTAGRAPTLTNEGKEISKHFGIYKQQERIEGRKSHTYIFMVRLRVPSGGEFSAAQWAAICEASDRFCDGSLRLTTRQGIQFHYVKPPSLGPLIRFLNQDYPSTGYKMSTLAACGDVNRNTMCCAVDDLLPELPLRSRELAYAIAMELAPRSSAYYQVFLTDEAGKTETPLTPDEPIYGPQYLPRKFKVAIAHPHDNSVDALTNDVAFVPVVNGGAVGEQYDLYAGGGLGTTHGMAHTKALLALYLGRVPRAQVVDATRAIAILQKEHGDRGDRRMARWKYTIRRLGVDAVKRALRERFQLELKDAEAQPLAPNRFFHGWHREAGAGRSFLGIAVESGRVRDTETCRMRSAVGAVTREIPEIGVRITGNQDLILAHVPDAKRARVDEILAAHGVPTAERVSSFRRQAFGCPALPTCGLAMTEAEHAIPGLADAVEAAGLGDVDVVVRMAGCPNHCSRPPTAEIGITGFGKNAHMIMVGGSREGTRVAHVLYEKISSQEMVPVLLGLLRAVRDSNPERLPAGEFLHRTEPARLRALVGVEA
ncbi:MAG TPA: NADPH-dependent assimilatory sulfite reductase hemoprotein subunit [Myxococcota bacterium]|nr:NADPH-dependent assimilatory sulfite reductase hemoprotein subunit [Myxococcota bacterium]